jgi:hypothetical protein
MAGGIIISGKVLTEVRFPDGRHDILLDGGRVGSVDQVTGNGLEHYEGHVLQLDLHKRFEKRAEAVAWIAKNLYEKAG